MDDALRVTVNSFLASGGDNFNALKRGRDARTGVMDIDAFEAFVTRGPAPPSGSELRIRRLH